MSMKVQLKIAGMLAAVMLIASSGYHAWAQGRGGRGRQDYRNSETRWCGSSYEGHRHVQGSVLRQVPRQRSS